MHRDAVSAPCMAAACQSRGYRSKAFTHEKKFASREREKPRLYIIELSNRTVRGLFTKHISC